MNFKPITTSRLIIRPLRTTDYEAWFAGFDKRLPSQTKFDDGHLDMSMCTQEWFDDLVSKHQTLRDNDDVYIFAIFDHENHHLGMIDVAKLARDQIQWSELGYTVHNYLWRKGYAFEAVSALLPFVNNELKFHRIEAHISVDNIPSKSLAKKLGFTYEVTRKNFIKESGQWLDKDVYYLNFD